MIDCKELNGFRVDRFGRSTLPMTGRSPGYGSPWPSERPGRTHPAREADSAGPLRIGEHRISFADFAFTYTQLEHSVEIWDFDNLPEPNGWEDVEGSDDVHHDSRGNLLWTTSEKNVRQYGGDQYNHYINVDLIARHRSFSRNYYSRDQKLRVHPIVRESVFYPTNDPGNPEYHEPWGAYEEYRYDALGRRILELSRQEAPVCGQPARCSSSIEHYVWDGDRILWELRQSETYASQADGDVRNPIGTLHTGVIGYVHAGAIDAPVGMIRNGEAIALHRNWRGLYAFATDTSGQPTTCAPDQLAGCDQVSWPGINVNLAFGYPDPTLVETWYGSLPMGQQDRTGLIYKRNRYYDSATGQFTQEDPIGIAGGLNLYGHAAGDPVNFSDPFGLFACKEDDLTCWELVDRLENANQKEAAEIFRQYTGGYVYLVPEDHPKMQTIGKWKGGEVDADGNVWLNSSFGAGDQIISAVHEARHLQGHSHPSGDRAAWKGSFDTEAAAYIRMRNNLRGSAWNHFWRLRDRGYSIPMWVPPPPIH